MPGVHELAPSSAARVVYVDRDPVVVAHAKLILADNPAAGAVRADLRDPASVIADPVVGTLLDPGKPVAVLMSLVLNFVPETDHPGEIVASWAQMSAPGSVLAVAHAGRGAHDRLSSPVLTALDIYSESLSCLTLRTGYEVETLFAGYELLNPGVTNLCGNRLAEHRMDPGRPHAPAVWAGVGVRP